MLKIDCLLKNTEIVDAVKAAVGYIGAHRVNEGKEASIETVFNTLRENGIEIDLGSTAHIYADTLSSQNHPYFNTREEVNQVAGRYFDDLSRALVLREDKTGEKKISDLSPAEAAVKGLVKAFTNPLVKDERTKSILKTMQDSYTQWAKKMVGKTPEEIETKKDTRSFEQIVKEAIDKEAIGYTDKVTGELNGFDKLHEGAKELMKKLDKEVAASGDTVLKAQWDEYAKSLENAVRTLMLSTSEGKKVLYDALKTEEGGGYIKTQKDGTEVLDHQKLAGEVDSISQYRENVIKALTASGFSIDHAEKTADSLQKEYFELRGKSLEILRKNQERKQQSYEHAEEKPTATTKEIVDKALKESKTYRALKNEAEQQGEDVSAHAPDLTFSKKDATSIVLDALKNTEEYGKEVADGEKRTDWLKLAINKPDPADLNKIIAEHLKNIGIKESDAIKVADKLLEQNAHSNLTEDIDRHSKSALDTKQKLLSKEVAPIRKSDMARLAELHAMGIFNGAHDDLLHHVLGIDSADQQTRKQLIDLFEKKQQLIQQLGAHEFLYHSLDAQLQHQVNNLIQQNIADKTKLGKIAKALYDYTNFVNMGIIANPFNIAENTLSGLQANLGQTVGIFKQMGMKQGVKVFYEMQRLWSATLRDVAKGGVHYGLESGKFSQGSAIADKLTIKKWDTLNPLQKVATGAIAYAHMGLNAMDSAYKAAIHQKTTMLNLHKALTDLPDSNGRKMSREEANDYLNDHLFGKSLEDAKKQTQYIYNQLGLKSDKNTIERSARELVQTNLFSDGQTMSGDTVEAALRSAYGIASVGLGHEARHGIIGVPAKMMKGLQTITQHHYDKLIKNGEYNRAAAFHIGAQTILVNGVFKFAHGVANWIILRPLTAGIGLVWGGINKFTGKPIDYNNKQQLEESFRKQAQANADINRAWVGLSMFALQAGATGLYGLLNQQEDKSAMASGFEAIKKNPVLNKAMNKFGADALALMYTSYTAKRHGEMEQTYANQEGFIKYMENLTNTGSGYSLPERMDAARKLRSYGTEEADEKSAGIQGEMAKTLIPGGFDLPFYRSYKGALYLVKSAAQAKAELPPYYNPQSIFQGVMDNGVFNDIDETLGLGVMYPKKKE